MTNVGRAFGFYVKYWQQMEALYYNANKREREALLKQLSGKEKMIEDVGRQAGEQAAELMKKCSSDITSHFEQFCNIRFTTRLSTMEKDWEIGARLWPKGGRDTTTYRCMTGIEWEYRNRCPTMLFYLWSRGGMSAESELAKIFGKRVVYRSNELDDWSGGSVILGAIPITLDDRKNFDVDRDRIVAEVRKILKKIRKKDIQKMFAI